MNKTGRANHPACLLFSTHRVDLGHCVNGGAIRAAVLAPLFIQLVDLHNAYDKLISFKFALDFRFRRVQIFSGEGLKRKIVTISKTNSHFVNSHFASPLLVGWRRALCARRTLCAFRLAST